MDFTTVPLQQHSFHQKIWDKWIIALKEKFKEIAKIKHY